MTKNTASELTGQNFGYVINSRSGCMRAVHLLRSIEKLTNLELKIRP